MCDSGQAPKITAFKVKMVEGSNWCVFARLEEALDCIKNELELGDFQYSYLIEPWETTEEELEGLPEHDGDFS